MATNDFLSFAGDPAANVMLQTDYAATGFTPRILGFSTGTALSIQLNKVWRQASLISSMVAQFTVNTIGSDMVDDGSTAGQATLLTNFTNAIAQAGGAGLAGKYLPLTGGTLTGPLGINAAANQLVINANTGQHAVATMNRNPGLVARWEAMSNNQPRFIIDIADNGPETGNNVGSNFVISRYADNGAYLDAPFIITRANGVVNFAHPPLVAGGPLPYLPITGGTLTGALALPLPGVYYNGTSYGHWIAFDWDGSFIRGWVDGGGVVYDIASTTWVSSVAGNYLPIGGGTIYNYFEADCSVTIDGGLWCRSTVYFGNLGDFANFTGGNWRYRQWAGNWYDCWDGGSGTRLWVAGPTGTNMTLDPWCNLSFSGTLHVYGGRIACGTNGSISVYQSGGTSQGMWAASDGLWFGWNDNNANPTQGLMRLDNGGGLSVWNGIVSYAWIQASSWISAGDQIWSNNKISARSGYPVIYTWNTSLGYAVGTIATSYGPNPYGSASYNVGSSGGDGGIYSTMSVLTNGGYYFVAGGVGTPSDRRLKSNIEPSDFDSLAAIRRIVHHSYDLESEGGTIHVPVGMVADEVKPLLPDVVVPGIDEMEYLDHAALISHAYKAIIQLAQQVEELKRG